MMEENKFFMVNSLSTKKEDFKIHPPNPHHILKQYFKMDKKKFSLHKDSENKKKTRKILKFIPDLFLYKLLPYMYDDFHTHR